jgi:hypothetical protein
MYAWSASPVLAAAAGYPHLAEKGGVPKRGRMTRLLFCATRPGCRDFT